MQVLLLSLPFSPFNPSSQLGVLAGHLDALALPGVTTETGHLFVHLARRVGLADWEQLSNTTGGIKLGNLLFQRLLFDRRGEPLEQLLGPDLLAGLAAGEGIGPPALARWEDAVDRFWEDLGRGALVDLDRPDLIGFSTVFNQLFPSLALARLIKQRRPDCRIVFGGVEVHGECGQAVLQRFPFVDAVVQGRGERPLGELIQRLATGSSWDGVGGVLLPAPAGEPPRPAAPRPAGERPLFGLPDHSEFYRTLQTAGLPREAASGLPVEASQGCYWRRCDFCGTREVFPCYALKDAEQIRLEVERAVARHTTYHVIFTDEAVPVRRLIQALEPLAAEPWARHLAFLAQIRATFGRADIAALAGLGLKVAQVGIESFSTAVLTRMDKGTTALQNLRCLRLCQEHGITVDYNLILGYPFADDEEQARSAGRFPLFWHLDPPQPSDFYVNRFSRLASEGGLPLGWTLRPAPIYNTELLPTELAGLPFIASEPCPAQPLPRPGEQRLREAMAQWRAHHRPNQLFYLHGKDFILINDARRGRPRTLRVAGLARDLLLACDDICSRRALLASFAARQAEAEVALEQLLEAGLLIQDGEELLLLAPCYPGRMGWD
ncbi:MAG: RiPP maturation radical SAM C-methyltransferase [Myxococcota bacterium]|nr:RiPP maturation radical SAM C-methyltransferase [Myxococcota bacterium]